MTREQQMEKFMEANKRMIERAKPGQERDYMLAMCAGFLTGVQMTNAITTQQYNDYYRELRELARRLEAARTEERNGNDVRIAV